MEKAIKVVLNKFISILTQKSRTNSVYKNIFLSGAVKVTSIIISLFTISKTLNTLNRVEYGIWLTIYSILSWLMYFDGGLSSGLKNRFTEAKAKGDFEKLKSYVSTSYFILTLAIVVLIPIFYIINLYIDWNTLLNYKQTSGIRLNDTIFYIFIVFCFHFVIKIIDSILIANQKSGIADFLNMTASFFSLLIFILISKYFVVNLLITGVIFCGTPLIINLLYSLYAYNTKFKYCTPSIAHIDLKYYKDLMSLGGKFFVIQLCSLLTIGTTNFIISNSLGASDVVTYNLVYKYFSFTTISFTIITSSLYSSISEAFHMGDLQWIRNAIKKSNYISYIILACIFVMCLFMDQVFKIWLGKDLEINNSIKILMAIYFSMLLFVSTYSTFVSSIGKIKIAFYFSVFNSVLTIPLSIYLAKKIGLNGIILVQIILAAPGLYWLPVQYYKIMQGKAKGIWNI